MSDDGLARSYMTNFDTRIAFAYSPAEAAAVVAALEEITGPLPEGTAQAVLRRLASIDDAIEGTQDELPFLQQHLDKLLARYTTVLAAVRLEEESRAEGEYIDGKFHQSSLSLQLGQALPNLNDSLLDLGSQISAMRHHIKSVSIQDPLPNKKGRAAYKPAAQRICDRCAWTWIFYGGEVNYKGPSRDFSRRQSDQFS